MRTRYRFDRQTTFQDWIAEWAAGVREQAATMEAGRERDELLRKLRLADKAMQLQDWVTPPGLKPPK